MASSDREQLVFDHQSKLILVSFEAAARVQGDVIRMLFLINGGALVALLALMGAVAKTGAVFPDSLGAIVMNFVNGLVAAVVAAVFSWMFQDLNAAAGHRLLIDFKFETDLESRKNWGTGLSAICLVIAIIVSLSCCLLGMSKSSVALSALAKSIPPAAAAPKP